VKNIDRKDGRGEEQGVWNKAECMQRVYVVIVSRHILFDVRSLVLSLFVWSVLIPGMIVKVGNLRSWMML
jgi:hypothetical protein